ncbi:MAG TPA: Rad52/Rad22 family DNA repair protein [Acidimicrobiales bacterium]
MTAETRGSVTPDQTERLLRPIKPGRVYESQGHSHVAGWDIAAHLTRMFGFCKWEKEILALEVVSEVPVEKNGRTGWYVTWRCSLRLKVFDQWGRLIWKNDDAATGTAQNQPSLGDAHDLAMKNAITYALKRCAKDLGDQFGLSLYNKGQVTPVVGMTLVDGSAATEPEITVDGEDHDPTAEQVSGPDDRGVVHGDGVEPDAEGEEAPTGVDGGASVDRPTPEPGTAPVEDGEPLPMTDAQSKKLHALLRSVRQATGPARHAVLSELVGRPIGSASDLSAAEARFCIDTLETEEAQS